MPRRPASQVAPVTIEVIQEAATACFVARGYHGSTMNDIAAAIGIRPSSLYNHTSSKQDLLQRVVDVAMTHAEQTVYPALEAAPDPRVRLHDAVTAHVRHHTRFLRETRIVQMEVVSLEPVFRHAFVARRREYARRWRALVQEGNDAGLFEARSAGMAARAIIEMGNAVSHWYRDCGPMSPGEVADEYAQLALRLVGAAQPLNEIGPALPTGRRADPVMIGAQRSPAGERGG